MKITFVLPYAGLAGGIRVVAVYAQMLKQRGHEVSVVSTMFRWPSRRQHVISKVRRMARSAVGRRDPSHLNETGVEHRVIKHGPPLTDADVPDADVIVATWWETAEWVAAMSLSKGAKAYFIQGYEMLGSHYAQRLDATWRLPMHKIVVARWLADIAAGTFDDREVSLAPNAVDHGQFYAEPRGKQATPTVGLMYSTKHVKGCDICLQAIELAGSNCPELELRAFGIHQPSEIPATTARLVYACEPAQDELRRIYASCDAWLFGSRCEGFGLPILEAMACRTPVIATPTGAAPELLSGGGGMLVGAEDPSDMARAIEEIVNLPEPQWRAMSDKAHEIAGRHRWENAVELFEAALVKTIERYGQQSDSAT